MKRKKYLRILHTVLVGLLLLVLIGCTVKSPQEFEEDAPGEPPATSNAQETTAEPHKATQEPNVMTGPIATAYASVAQVAFATRQPPEPFPDTWGPWLKENSHALESLTSEDFTDLMFLVPLLENRRIVQLGENSHWIAEYSSAKVRLIKFLHEELGYNIIAFESGLFEGYWTHQHIAELTQQEAMQNSIFDVWHTAEVAELFSYLESTQSTDTPLILAGFDVQPSGEDREQKSSKFLRDVIAVIDQDYADEVFAFDNSFWENYDIYAGIAELDKLPSYITLTEYFDHHMEELLTIYAEDISIPLAARQTAWSTIRFIEVLTARSSSASFLASGSLRDRAMAENVDFLLNVLYPNEKIILWAHNAHIANSPGQQAYLPMGAFLSNKYEEDLYTIGLYGYGVNIVDTDKDKTFLAGTTDALFHAVGQPYLFVDLSQHQREAGNEWIFDGLKFHSFQIHDIKPVARNYFDAILFIDSISYSNPEYLNNRFNQ